MTNLWHKIIIPYLVLLAWLAIPFFFPFQIDGIIVSIVLGGMATIIVLLFIFALKEEARG